MPRAAASLTSPASPPTPTKPVCLIHGSDDYAVKQRARHIYHNWCEELGGMDHEIIDATASNSAEALRAITRLREALNTLPFFGTGKVVWLQNCNFLGSDRTSQAQAVSQTLTDLTQELKQFAWQNVRLLVSATEVDKRRSLAKTFEKIGSVEQFAAWSIDDKNWASQAESVARRTLKARKKTASEEALAELVNRVGPNSRQLANEIEKLGLYAGDRDRIEVTDVLAVVSRNKQARAFAVSEALGNRDLPRLLQSLDEELWSMKSDKKRTAIGLLYGLIAKLRSLIFLKEMIREGWVRPGCDYGRFKAQLEQIPTGKLPEDRRFNPLSMHPFVLHKALAQASRYSNAELVRAMGLLLHCNQRLVASSLDDALVLQQTLIEIVRSSTATATAATPSTAPRTA